MRAHWVFLVAATLTAAVPTAGHIGARVFPFYEIPVGYLPDLTDGSVLDWEEAVPGPSIEIGDLTAESGVGDKPSLDPADLAYRVFLGWSPELQRIYVAVERIDDIYVNEYDPTSFGNWMNDSVQFMIDADHSGGRYGFSQSDLEHMTHEEIGRLTGASAQRYWATAEGPDRLIRFVGQASWVLDSPWTAAGGIQRGESPNYSLVELMVTPWDDLVWTGLEASTQSFLQGGRIVGFGITLADYDDRARRLDNVYHVDGVYNLGGVTGEGSDAAMLADGILVCLDGCSGEPPSAITVDSWGRIKATFGQ